MKKKILSIILVAIIILTGCGKASDQFLLYGEYGTIYNDSVSNQSSKMDYVSKDLTVITKEENVGGDKNLTAGALLLVNHTKNEVIYADHIYDKLYPASITKIMTALLVLKYANLNDNVTISYNASHITEKGAKTCGLKEGDVLTMEVLLNSMLVYSGNDTSIAIAEHMAGSVEAFQVIMNEEAKRLGAVGTHFVNPNGLHDEEQYTTAYDLYLIFRELLQFEQFHEIIHQTSYIANYVDKDGLEKQGIFETTNEYLKGGANNDFALTVLGGKTGTTSKAGNCLILLSKNKENEEYISVILKAKGSPDLYQEMSLMLSKVK